MHFISRLKCIEDLRSTTGNFLVEGEFLSTRVPRNVMKEEE